MFEQEQKNYFIHPKIQEPAKELKHHEISNLVSFVSQEKSDKHSTIKASIIRKAAASDLQTIIDQYEKLSKEQIEKWKFFYNKVNQLNSFKEKNPLIDQIKKESIKTIEYLLGKNSN